VEDLFFVSDGAGQCDVSKLAHADGATIPQRNGHWGPLEDEHRRARAGGTRR